MFGMCLLVDLPDTGLLAGRAAEPGRAHPGAGQRAAGQRQWHPPGCPHLLQERDSLPTVGVLLCIT